MGTNVVEREDVVLLSKLSIIGEVMIESKTEFFYPFPSYIQIVYWLLLYYINSILAVIN